ncbi:chromophore lyase CpcT/CpeT [Synechococcus sp. M16CYN]|uniref:chromophore lyase CpcT/CpeT n=1 Tax=Synechococcus sp. M16CYN TaxID=3103139 RepID=UPI0030E198E8
MDINKRLKFANTLAGIYDNYAQSQKSPKNFARINIVFRPLPWEIFNGPGFYSEQYYNYAPWQPYRQGIHRLEVKEKIYILNNYGFADKERIAGAGRNPELLQYLNINSLSCRFGCAMHFREKTSGCYIGSVEPGKKCLIPRDGYLTYLVSEVQVDQDNWISRDRGFDLETNQPRWGSEHGLLRFKRIKNISEIINSSWIQNKE